MKRLFQLLAMAIGSSLYAQGTWTPLNSGTASNLRDIFFVSADTGFAVGEDSTVLYTTNSGNSWTILNPSFASLPGNLNAIWMNSSSSGFMAPEFLTGIPQTSNGGTSWSDAPQNNMGNPCYPIGLFFDGPNEGYMYGQGCFGGTYISAWDGNAWNQEQLLYYGFATNFDYVVIEGMAKDPANSVYVAVTNYGKIFRSTNGFQNWDTIPYNDTTEFTAVDYAGNNTFYASSTEVMNSVYISTDGGQTFAYDQTYMPTFFYSGYYDIDMLTNGFGVAAGFSQTTGRGFIQMRSPSMGWSSFNSYYTVDHILRAAYVVDSTLAFVAGDSGAIYRYDIPTGINDANSIHENISVFPSVTDANGIITVNYSGRENWMLEIFDANGKRIQSFTNLNGKKEISAFAESSGIYLVKATGMKTGQTACTKILIR